MATRRNFQFVEGSSSKFWEVWQEGSKVMTRYGRIGSDGQTTVKDEGSPAAATKLHDKLVAEKTKKGYVEQGAGAPKKAGAGGFKHSLFERLEAWVGLLAKRGDVEFSSELNIAGRNEDTLPSGFGQDAVAFAKQCAGFSFSYKAGECAGFLYLHLEGAQEEAFMELDGKEVDPESMYMLDADAEGTGHAAWYLAGKKPQVVWDVESMSKFKSLDAYLTEGAKRGFAYNPCWQRREAEVPLAALSVPKSTPPAELEKALVAQGASKAMAADLIEWLGASVHLLIPAKAKAAAKAPAGKKGKPLKLKQLPTVWSLPVDNTTGLVADAQRVRVSDTHGNIVGVDRDGGNQSLVQISTAGDGESLPSIVGDGSAVYAVKKTWSADNSRSELFDIGGAKPRAVFKVEGGIVEAAMIAGAFAFRLEDTVAVFDAKGAKRWIAKEDPTYRCNKLIAASALGVFCDGINHGEDACVMGFDWNGKRRFQVKTKSSLAGLGATPDGCVALTKSGELISIAADGTIQARLFCPTGNKKFPGGAACAGSPDGRLYAGANGWLFCFDAAGTLLFEAPVADPKKGYQQLATLRAENDVLFGITDRGACHRIDVSAEGLARGVAGTVTPNVLPRPEV